MAAHLGKQLEEAMLVILTPVNNEAIQKASAFLNKSSKQTQAVMPLHAYVTALCASSRRAGGAFLARGSALPKTLRPFTDPPKGGTQQCAVLAATEHAVKAAAGH